jgi:RNA polymerase sigma factor (sigma-70 family)
MSESMCPTFTEALAKGQQGDDAALGQILDQHVRKLYGEARRLISKRLQPLIDPADLLQSTRIILWVGLRQGKWDVTSPQQLTALARTILRRQATRICRALKGEFSKNTIEIKLADTLTDFPITMLSDHNPGAETELEDAVQRILRGLDDIDRDLIRFRLLGYSTSYAAKRLNVSAGSLRVRLGRMRKRLLEFGALQRILSDD